MKRINKIILILLAVLLTVSCNEEEWLKEKPMDFYTPENAFQSKVHLYKFINAIYSDNLYYFFIGTPGELIFNYPSDILYGAISPEQELNSYKDALVPEAGQLSNKWDIFYSTIARANTILAHIDDPGVDIEDEKERNSIKGEAMFFRGWTYMQLGILWGGVPIVKEEVTTPNRDYVRATREEVWEQVIADLTFAAQNLYRQSELKEDGHVTRGAALHALSEIYIITKQWDKAIEAATAVIDDPDYELMTNRFGTWKNKPGDVYSDLFRRGNVNYNGLVDKNKEAIWVWQYEYKVGGSSSRLCHFVNPYYTKLKGNDGKSLFVGPTTQNGGISTGWCGITDYLVNQVWTDPNDMRTSEYNIMRDLVADYPRSAYYGKKIIESGAITDFDNKYNKFWSAIFTKLTPVNDHPAEITDPTTGLITSFSGQSYNDTYIFRLAETYLLRAEAYLGKGDNTKAAADINAVRARANAAPVAPADVDIDYILDERARELCFEEFRVETLMRLGMQQERVDKYNFMSKGTILDRNKLWPIPQKEIERNTDAVLEQNPGY